MNKKQTLQQKLHSKKLKKPPYLIYNVLGGIWKILFMKKYGVKYEFKTDFRKEKGPYIILSNHASRQDYIFTGIPMLPNTLNYIAGYNEFFRSHLAGVFSLLKVIPKKNFTADMYTIKEVTRIIKQGGKVMLFPEGMNSISGANQPIAIGTGKFIKHFKLPVYFSVIKGGYLTCPKYDLTDRPGRVEVVFDQLFTCEDTQKLTVEEIEDKINKALYHDDYAWNKIHKYKYKTNNNSAKNLHHLLFWCPKCHSEFKMIGKGNTILCTNCGNGATIDDTYTMTPLNDECLIPETQTKWFNMQREEIKKQIQDENFAFTEKVKLGMLDEYNQLKDQKTSNIVGEGTLTINHNGLTFIGKKGNKDFTFNLRCSELPTYGMCTDMTRFYTFFKGEFYEFYPENPVVEKFFLATEELHRLHNGKWKDFKFDK